MAQAQAVAATATRRTGDYETIYILRPDTEAEESQKIADRVKDVIERAEGRLLRVDNWGKRKLAYHIRKLTRGVFVYVRYCGYNELVAELERNLRLLEPVIRFQTVVLARDVDMAGFEVDPEAVQFVPVEVTDDDEEEEEGLEQRLGLVVAPAEAEVAGSEGEEGAEDDADRITSEVEVASAAPADAAPADAAPADEAPVDSDTGESETASADESDSAEKGE